MNMDDGAEAAASKRMSGTLKLGVSTKSNDISRIGAGSIPDEEANDPCAKAGWIRPTPRQQSLKSKPRYGQYYWVDFPKDTREPEFVSRHPAIVVRAGGALSDACVVVPITSSEPEEIRPYHYKLLRNPNPHDPNREIWAICNHLYTVHPCRLSPVRKRGMMLFPKATEDDMKGIVQAIQAAFPFLVKDAPAAQPPES